MRLADMIREDTTPWYDDFRLALADAEKFEISEDVGRMAFAIASSDASRIESIKPFCRLPFQNVWIEWSGSAMAFRYENPIAEYGKTAPDRMGVLCQRMMREGTAIISFAWGYKRKGVMVAPHSAFVDWREEPKMAVEKWGYSSRDDAFKIYRDDLKFKSNTDDELWRLVSRGTMGVNLHMQKMWDDFKAGLITKDQMQALADDVSGETPFVEAVIAIMNSKNLVRDSPDDADLTKLNRARVKRGKPPFLQFRKVSISLSRGAAARSASHGDGVMPLHVVRGHFKVRKSGIYWWSPFWRGDANAGVVSRTGYKVVA